MQTLTIKTPKTPHKKRENSEKKREFSQIPSTKNDTHTTQGKLPSLKIQKKKKKRKFTPQPSFITAFIHHSLLTTTAFLPPILGPVFCFEYQDLIAVLGIVIHK